MNENYYSQRCGDKVQEDLTNAVPMIALYYWYVDIPKGSLKQHCDFHKSLCTRLNLYGRIRISEDGLNGVLSGKRCDLECYETELKKEVTPVTMMMQVSSCCEDEEEEQEHESATSSSTTSRYGKVLDVKYCHLRKDIPMEKQMFTSLSIKITQEVVSLNETLAAATAVVEQQQHKHNTTVTRFQKKGRGRSKRIQQQQFQSSESPPHLMMRDTLALDKYEPARHLTPQEWNEKLLQDSELVDSNAVLIDARNVYESNIGHFKIKGIPTILTNTRKYSTIPSVLKASIPNLAGKNVYMYCTGGVRCERASVYLQALSDSNEWPDGYEKPKCIYQLQGGIQKYLETYGKRLDDGDDDEEEQEQEQEQETVSNHDDDTPHGPCLFAGKNFVFDNRRYDPVIGSHEDTIGRCVMCNTLHDDYDNGHAPCDNKEARCCRCRVLVLVCNDCRGKYLSWGEETSDVDHGLLPKEYVFCGGTKNICINEGNEVEHVEVKSY